MLLHHLVIEWLLALDTALGRETAVRFNDLFVWDASPSFKGIDILGKTLIQKGVFRKETNEGVCNRWTEFSWVEFMCKSVNFARKKLLTSIRLIEFWTHKGQDYGGRN